AAGMGYAAYRASNSQKRREVQAVEAKQIEDKQEKAKPEQADALLPLDLISLEVGYGLIGLVDSDQQGDLLERIQLLRRQFAQEWGFVVPPVHIRDNLELKPHAYTILIKGCPVAQFELKQGHLLAMAAEEDDGAQIGGIPTIEPAFGLPAFWLAETKRDQAA